MQQWKRNGWGRMMWLIHLMHWGTVTKKSFLHECFLNFYWLVSTIRSHILSKVCVVKYLLSMCNLLVDTCTKGSKSQIILLGFIRNRFYSRLLNSKCQQKKERKEISNLHQSFFLVDNKSFLETATLTPT